jgi:hypothetical protein
MGGVPAVFPEEGGVGQNSNWGFSRLVDFDRETGIFNRDFGSQSSMSVRAGF